MAGYRIAYQGWSGFLIESEARPDAGVVIVDPAVGAEIPDRPGVLLITHGHPEHIEGAAVHLGRRRRHSLRVLASRSVCRYLSRFSGRDSLIPVRAGERHVAGAWSVDVFSWEHMGLLPPGLRGKSSYLGRLLTHPAKLASIAWSGLRGPRHGPMFGFRLGPVEPAPGELPNPDELPKIIYFGEGLHRRTSGAELDGGLGDGGLLLAAVEPEDCASLPALLHPRAGSLRGFVAFEAHRGWRESFGLPQADLQALGRAVPGLRLLAPRPGEVLRLPGD